MEKLFDSLAAEFGVEPSHELYSYSRALLNAANVIWSDEVQYVMDWDTATEMRMHVKERLLSLE